VRALPLPRALQVLGVLLAVVALARPVRRELLPLRAEGIDLLLVLDTSSSMTADDMDRRRTRLEVARDAAAAFARGRPDDRIGLVTFARYADVRCPPTLDHVALAAILREVEPVEGDGPEDATGIGTAVARAAQVLSGSDARSRVAILLTDGEENVATGEAAGEIAPSHAAQLCERLGVRVYAIAAGPAAPATESSPAGRDDRPLERLARRTGGAFHRAQDAGAVSAVFARIDALERTPIEEPRWAVEDRFLAFLAAALVLVLLGRILSSTVLAVSP
jgi:Ca-activated chloride channel family protein